MGLLMSSGTDHTTHALGPASAIEMNNTLMANRMELFQEDLLQLSEGLNLDAEVDSKVQSFVDLNMGEKMSIVQALKAGDKSQTSTEWGFLKNIINIDRFFSSDVDGSTTASDESEPDAASE